MRIGLLQINPTAGDLAGNAALIIRATREAQAGGADLVVTPELALMGYLPRDLLMNGGFVRRSSAMLRQIASELSGAPPVLVGIATPNPSEMGRPLFNSAVLLHKGAATTVFHKRLLPTYDVFDEDRYFEPAVAPQFLECNGGCKLGISICEDVWNDRDFWSRQRYHQDPIEVLADFGAQAIVNLSASPFFAGKQLLRERMLSHIAQKYGLPVAYVNQVGGNDDLIFDGRSCAFDRQGRLVGRAAGFREDVLVVDLAIRSRITEDDFENEAEIWNALVLGVHDYAAKTRFSKVLLGLSGGIDSALTAAIAADAMGPENVLGVLMPSCYSSRGSVDDSMELAQSLGIETITLPIAEIMRSYDCVLQAAFRNHAADVTEENIQSRIRGNLLMALSNKFGSLLLTTGNKSELAVGYCTLYGDMNGGLAVIGDVPKMMVYRIAAWRNRRRPDIPENILTKAPSAELRPNQTDQDSLPPYDVLDPILELHVEQCQSAEEILARGFDQATVHRALRLVRIAEFKRKQAAPVLKVTSRAFGTGWRMPIVRAE